MQFNRGRFNAGSINGSGIPRIPVEFAGDASWGIAGELAAIRRGALAGTASVECLSAIAPSAQRFLVGGMELAPVAALVPSVYRSARGDATISVSGSLYYVKQLYGYGTAVVGLHLQGHVGVTFIEGESVLLPCAAELEGARVRHSAGTAEIILDGDFLASAIRRPQVSTIALLQSVGGLLEPSHYDQGGIRHVGMFGDLPVAFIAEDAGMLRQTLIGSLDMRMLSGTGALTIRRPTLAGDGVSTLGLSAAFQAIRQGEGASLISLVSACAGEIFVRGEGAAPLSLSALGAGSVHRKGMAGVLPIVAQFSVNALRVKAGRGDMVLGLFTELSGTRKPQLVGNLIQTLTLEGTSRAYRRGWGDWVTPSLVLEGQGDILVCGEGAAAVAVNVACTETVYRNAQGEKVLLLTTEGTGLRRKTGGGDSEIALEMPVEGTRQVFMMSDARIDVLDFGYAVLNPAALDIDRQRFVRPASQRQFERATIQREFRR
ncbi:hypothetical protein [Thauera aromatica]|uniref:hypothetical protein n=1 Tax=Thauera aromatica TaxID=59405 RepID=UPI001FFCFA4A|nr:hypothetical protein [Thauera aromatica]MCK2097520.1 hypothetical protein [Thauera aromatica]